MDFVVSWCFLIVTFHRFCLVVSEKKSECKCVRWYSVNFSLIYIIILFIITIIIISLFSRMFFPNLVNCIGLQFCIEYIILILMYGLISVCCPKEGGVTSNSMHHENWIKVLQHLHRNQLVVGCSSRLFYTWFTCQTIR